MSRLSKKRRDSIKKRKGKEKQDNVEDVDDYSHITSEDEYD